MQARIALATALFVLSAAGCPREQDTAEVSPRFQTEHDAILDHLVADFWSEDGDWEGDMQGDATAFAPRVLYAAGEERGEGRYAEMAGTTVEHEVALLQAYLLTHVLTMDAVIGAPGLADGYEVTHNETWRALFLGGAAMGYDMMVTDPDQFLPYVFDLATVYGSGATMCFRAWELSELEAHRTNGLDLVARADAEAWDEAEGRYDWTLVMDWPQATMIMALVGAYRATGDEAYLERAQRVHQTMEEQCWDDERGGWLAASGAHGKGLSGNNNMAWALLDLYEVTGDRTVLARAGDTLAYTLTEDLYSAEEAMAYHHADYYCTGCNFQLLANVQRYHRNTGFERAAGLASE